MSIESLGKLEFEVKQTCALNSQGSKTPKTVKIHEISDPATSTSKSGPIDFRSDPLGNPLGIS